MPETLIVVSPLHVPPLSGVSVGVKRFIVGIGVRVAVGIAVGEHDGVGVGVECGCFVDVGVAVSVKVVNDFAVENLFFVTVV